MHLTLLVPELVWPEPADAFTLGKLPLPGLEWLLARAVAERAPARPYEAALAGTFGVAGALGALRLLGEGEEAARSGHWLCADPVHLRFHHERIILADAGAFDLDRAEADALAAALNAEFADVGTFHVGDARRWYLRLHDAVDHPVPPLSAVAGRRVDGALSALPLARWLNEVQMFLHGQPANVERAAAGQPAVNSLWLWGGGTLPAPASTFTSVFGGGPLAAGLARASGMAHAAAPDSLAELPATAGERPLVVLDALLPRVIYEDGDGWRTAHNRLDETWFVPLKNALGRRVDRASLIAPTIYGEIHYTVGSGERWKFWKRARPLADTAKELAA
ncbi:MAG: hypothetical protein FIB06_07965 [Betaproteobacteria bacterium]|nr:hypothetical protein [Betaproteobacteria bacterium]